jgi:Domain of unknown function (DU1801)
VADNKTKPSRASVSKFLAGIDDPVKRKDAQALCKMMEAVTGEKPVLWGDAILGFGTYHYKYASGREGDAPVAGFSPRKQNLTVYLLYGFDEQTELMSKLGKHSTSKSCLYIKRLEDVDQKVLQKVITASVKQVRRQSHV